MEATSNVRVCRTPLIAISLNRFSSAPNCCRSCTCAKHPTGPSIRYYCHEFRPGQAAHTNREDGMGNSELMAEWGSQHKVLFLMLRCHSSLGLTLRSQHYTILESIDGAVRV